ncbi:hypothetical protein Pfo_003408 [Paulownia fortunei]|nr:hypothetical protein Pfo_003408 [Paulownia fortunei]
MNQPINLIPLSNISVSNAGAELISDNEYLKNLPVGYRFPPTDNELIVHYLKRKVDGEPLSPNEIHMVNLYEFSPDYILLVRLINQLGHHHMGWIYQQFYHFTSYALKNTQVLGNRISLVVLQIDKLFDQVLF